MRILITDDERAARDDLERVINNVVKVAEIEKASSAAETIELVKNKTYDVIFLDVQLLDTDGITVAKDIQRLNPHSNIVIQTAYSDYSMDAWNLFASGFILKPVREKDVRFALGNLRFPVNDALQKLEVRCFGQFEVFWNDKPLAFARSKTKEMLAYLVSSEGASCTFEEIASVLWENVDDMTNAKAYIRNLIFDLKKTLDTIGMGSMVVRKNNEVAIQKSMIDCDYYRYLEGNSDEGSTFRGEFMSQYSWAEDICGKLWFE